ncbi:MULTISPECIES: thioredoxin domain-containing protein [Streptococcus]|uniref:Thioredoxin domain-containing protein n=1 Tax=Streptococcus caledonicus TaxID=2614158 RepID=A0ABW0UGR3_9STRE|nr:thioredoxin domain-containing protein [Streptococcus sp. S784/96/1]
MTFAQSFVKITALEAENRIQSAEKFTLFIGRSSCPFCRLFEPKLTNVANALNEAVYFLNSEDFSDATEIQKFRSKYGIPTVPCLLVSNGGTVKVVCDSSLSEDAITEFITDI